MATATTEVKTNVPSPTVPASDLKDAISKAVEKAVPGQPQDLNEIYKLQFKKGKITSDLYFKWTSDQKDAERVGRDYCSRFKFRFIWVNKMCVDIMEMPFNEENADDLPAHMAR